ncbi:dihydroxyacetone kinase subunit DhaL [Acidithiobacillus caldus]|uniref:dihydroxyacetone kinase subunit DhaL n=1 Tax=Acidithiobacillus caldus TaxID=33059 RepID=UPI001C075927|nr:dihydroxyacetone kinase subunit DhaL [Acidithiobacillus caldus]MBU2763607.1 dihydroxyacetone kinase subunit L [Acidithiobacillus caldus]MBU2769867.1 dihydroxyacetone kinase subunit L [Acidithiobacillus caldus]MBU2782040.1 dihydroxyacetone kinase subunit L [Acidithiobacillus caldus]
MKDLAALENWLRCIEARLAQEKDNLNALDAAIGDADHGSNLFRGFHKVWEKLEATPPTDLPALFKLVGMTLIGTVGGASGPLYGTFFLEAGKTLPAGSQTLDDTGLAAALAAGLAGLQRLGKAEKGDKTMVDALLPAIDTLQSSADLQKAAEAARQGLAATIPLIARKGRASYLGERSRGHADPGAASASLILECLAGDDASTS